MRRQPCACCSSPRAAGGSGRSTQRGDYDPNKVALLAEAPKGDARYRDGVIGMDALWSGFLLDFEAMRLEVQVDLLSTARASSSSQLGFANVCAARRRKRFVPQNRSRR